MENLGRSEREGKVTERKDEKMKQPMLSERECVAICVDLLQSLPNMIATMNLHFTQTSLKLYNTSTQANNSHNFRKQEKRVIWEWHA